MPRYQLAPVLFMMHRAVGVRGIKSTTDRLSVEEVVDPLMNINVTGSVQWSRSMCP